jgi:hypothetical protein
LTIWGFGDLGIWGFGDLGIWGFDFGQAGKYFQQKPESKGFDYSLIVN